MLPHYPAIVEFIFNNRFAIGSQVQRRFPDWLRSRRTAQYQLASLSRLGYLAVAPVRSTGPHFPYVYYATKRGVDVIRRAYEQLNIPRSMVASDSVKSVGFAFDSILHELMLTEFGLALQRTLDNREDLSLAYSERRFFRREQQMTYMTDGHVHNLIPDYGFLVCVNNAVARHRDDRRSTRLLHFLEWDNGTMSLARIGEKYRQYEGWAQSEQGRLQLAHILQRHGLPAHSTTFRLLMIAHDKGRAGRDTERMVDLLAEAIDLPAEMRDRIWLTTAEQLVQVNEHSAPLATPLWIRARDARSWMAHYRRQFAIPRLTGGRRFSHVRRQHIFERLSNMPKHAMLPRPSDGVTAE